jgi:hypothetical protein
MIILLFDAILNLVENSDASLKGGILSSFTV